ncbi:MAG TPA: DUF6470 family protein [Bacillota bacterium]|nr:DUF6470 family protein [Bacillota bacterium]
MRVPQIRMQSQFAKIGMEQQFASLNIQQPKADLKIEQHHAKMSIEAPKGELIIDQSQAWEEANLMSTPRLIEKQGAEGLQAVAEGAARRAEQGDELMKIEQSNNPIYNQALENGFQQQKTLSLKYMPSPFSVKIDYIPADVHIEFIAQAPTIEAVPNKPIIDFEPSVLNIYMEQYESLDIDYENLFSITV